MADEDFHQRQVTPDFNSYFDESASTVTTSEEALLYSLSSGHELQPNSFTSEINFESIYSDLDFHDDHTPHEGDLALNDSNAVELDNSQYKKSRKRKQPREDDDESPSNKRQKTSSKSVDEPKKASSKKRKRDEDSPVPEEDCEQLPSKKKRTWYKYHGMLEGPAFLRARGYFADVDHPMTLEEMRDQVDVADYASNPNRDKRSEDRKDFLKRLYNAIVKKEKQLLKDTIKTIAGPQEAERFVKARAADSKFSTWGALLPYGHWYPENSILQDEARRQSSNRMDINQETGPSRETATRVGTQEGHWVLAPEYAQATTAVPEVGIETTATPTVYTVPTAQEDSSEQEQRCNEIVESMPQLYGQDPDNSEPEGQHPDETSCAIYELPPTSTHPEETTSPPPSSWVEYDPSVPETHSLNDPMCGPTYWNEHLSNPPLLFEDYIAFNHMEGEAEEEDFDPNFEWPFPNDASITFQEALIALS